MWIRSQDKETLIETKYLRIFFHEINYVIYATEHISPNEKTLLGTCSTKEKALDVLDTIERKIFESNVYNIRDGDYGDKNFSQLVSVFQMPLDSEVNKYEKRK